jgi:hypothetical protein
MSAHDRADAAEATGKIVAALRRPWAASSAARP